MIHNEKRKVKKKKEEREKGKGEKLKHCVVSVKRSDLSCFCLFLFLTVLKLYVGYQGVMGLFGLLI